MPAPKPARSSSTEPSSASASTHGPHVVDPQPVLGHQVRAAGAGRAHVQSVDRALEVGEVPLRDAHRRRPRRRTSMSTTPLASCTSIGPMSSGAKTPSPPPSIIAGPPMPMLASSVAMMTSQQPSSAALPAKQRPEAMPTSGTRPREPAEQRGRPWRRAPRRPGRRCRPAGRRRPRRRARPAAARRRQLEHAVRLAVVVHALGAGQHGVVVGHHDAAGAPGRPSPLTVASPPTMPSAGVCSISSSSAAAARAGRRWPARRTRRSCPRRRGRRCSPARCAGPGRAALPTASGGRSSSPISCRSSTSARSGADVRRGRRRRPRAAVSATSRVLDGRAGAVPGARCRRPRPPPRRPSAGRGRHDVLHLHRLEHHHGCPGATTSFRQSPRRRRPCRATGAVRPASSAVCALLRRDELGEVARRRRWWWRRRPPGAASEGAERRCSWRRRGPTSASGAPRAGARRRRAAAPFVHRPPWPAACRSARPARHPAGRGVDPDARAAGQLSAVSVPADGRTFRPRRASRR